MLDTLKGTILVLLVMVMLQIQTVFLLVYHRRTMVKMRVNCPPCRVVQLTLGTTEWLTVFPANLVKLVATLD